MSHLPTLQKSGKTCAPLRSAYRLSALCRPAFQQAYLQTLPSACQDCPKIPSGTNRLVVPVALPIWIARPGTAFAGAEVQRKTTSKRNVTAHPACEGLTAAHRTEPHVGGHDAQRSAVHAIEKRIAGTSQPYNDLLRPTLEDQTEQTRDHQTPSTHRRGGITNVTATLGSTRYAQGTTNVHVATIRPPQLSTTSWGATCNTDRHP